MPTQKQRDMLTWDDETLSAWIDAEAAKRDRSRSWMLQEAVRQWRNRLEADRRRRKKSRRNAARNA